MAFDPKSLRVGKEALGPVPCARASRLASLCRLIAARHGAVAGGAFGTCSKACACTQVSDADWMVWASGSSQCERHSPQGRESPVGESTVSASVRASHRASNAVALVASSLSRVSVSDHLLLPPRPTQHGCCHRHCLLTVPWSQWSPHHSNADLLRVTTTMSHRAAA